MNTFQSPIQYFFHFLYLHLFCFTTILSPDLFFICQIKLSRQFGTNLISVRVACYVAMSTSCWTLKPLYVNGIGVTLMIGDMKTDK